MRAAARENPPRSGVIDVTDFNTTTAGQRIVDDGRLARLVQVLNDPYERFGRGVPPSSSADWGWVQHLAASLADGGRLAVVLDTGAVSRGSGNSGSNKERDIRKQFVEADLIEYVLLLPENLFYNTTAPGIITSLSYPASGGP